MRRLFAHRVGHHLLLVAVAAGVLFPHLGATALWDDDEGVNAECAREMREAGTWIVPTFNWELRTAKPVFLYWLMRASYAAFGETERAARLPSALLSIGTVLLVYELGRRMFDAATGLLAGIVTVTSLEVCKLAHAATPDATLLFFTVLYFLCFWAGTANGGRGWFVPCGIASGFAFLTKGPVGLVLPSAVVLGWFAWRREPWRWWDRRMAWGALTWTLVAVPWYALVTAETRGEWLRTFFLKENLGRSAEPMENHRGPVVYYLVAVCAMFAPWSAFLWATVRASLVPPPLASVLLWSPPSPGGRGVRGEGDWRCEIPLPPNPPPLAGGGDKPDPSPPGRGVPARNGFSSSGSPSTSSPSRWWRRSCRTTSRRRTRRWRC